MKKILPLYLSAVLALTPLAKALAESKSQPKNIPKVAEEQIRENLESIEQKHIDYARNILGIPDTLYQETEEGEAEELNHENLDAYIKYCNVVKTLTRKIKESAEGLTGILGNGKYTAKEDSVAYQNNFYIIPENSKEIKAMNDFLEDVVGESYGKDSEEYKTFEAQINSLVGYVKNEINPRSGRLMGLHDNYFAAAIKHAQKTSRNKSLVGLLDPRNLTGRGIITKTLLGVIIGGTIYTYTAKRGGNEAEGGYSQSGDDAFRAH